jgi:hypothetical protein
LKWEEEKKEKCEIKDKEKMEVKKMEICPNAKRRMNGKYAACDISGRVCIVLVCSVFF